MPPIVVTAVAGQLDLPLTQDSIYRNVSRITTHPDYNYTTMANDIAVVEVVKDFPIDGRRIAVVQLTNRLTLSGKCLVSGWGVENFVSLLKKLKEFGKLYL